MLRLRDTHRVPFKGKGELRWYQVTPAPKLVCSFCGGMVKSTATDSKWLWLFLVSIAIAVGSMLFEYISGTKLHPFLELAWQACAMLIAGLAVFMVHRTAKWERGTSSTVPVPSLEKMQATERRQHKK